MPYINDVPISCINQAAVMARVPATLIISILKTEGGKVGMVNRNTNGTYDYGPMQINSIWENTINKAGFTLSDIQYNPCINVAIGAYILSRNIKENPSVWTGVGNYHSHTDSKNFIYHQKVSRIYFALNEYLNEKSKKVKKCNEIFCDKKSSLLKRRIQDVSTCNMSVFVRKDVACKINLWL